MDKIAILKDVKNLTKNVKELQPIAHFVRATEDLWIKNKWNKHNPHYFRFYFIKAVGLKSNEANSLLFEKGCEVWYSADANLNESRMLIAHELGHFTLHSKDIIGQELSYDTDDIDDPEKENEATYFGIQILKERASFLKDVGKNTTSNSKELKYTDFDTLAKSMYPNYEE